MSHKVILINKSLSNITCMELSHKTPAVDTLPMTGHQKHPRISFTLLFFWLVLHCQYWLSLLGRTVRMITPAGHSAQQVSAQEEMEMTVEESFSNLSLDNPCFHSCNFFLDFLLYLLLSSSTNKRPTTDNARAILILAMVSDQMVFCFCNLVPQISLPDSMYTEQSPSCQTQQFIAVISVQLFSQDVCVMMQENTGIFTGTHS